VGIGVDLDGREISPPPGFDPWTVQPVASRCTNCAIPVVISKYYTEILVKELRKSTTIIGERVRIRTAYLHNARLEYYFHTELLQH
jgi:hypothetical protein